MKVNPFVLAALMLAASFVAGQSVVVLDRVEHSVRARIFRSRVDASVQDATQLAQRFMRVLLCVAKS